MWLELEPTDTRLHAFVTKYTELLFGTPLSGTVLERCAKIYFVLKNLIKIREIFYVCSIVCGLKEYMLGPNMSFWTRFPTFLKHLLSSLNTFCSPVCGKRNVSQSKNASQMWINEFGSSYLNRRQIFVWANYWGQESAHYWCSDEALVSRGR